MCEVFERCIDKGIEQGIEQGMTQGMIQAKRTVIINMLKENDPLDKICRVAECDETYVMEIKEELD